MHSDGGRRVQCDVCHAYRDDLAGWEEPYPGVTVCPSCSGLVRGRCRVEVTEITDKFFCGQYVAFRLMAVALWELEAEYLRGLQKKDS